MSTATDWLTAVGTVGAFFSGGWLLVLDNRRSRRTEAAARDTEAAAREVERRAQADSVACWIEWTPVLKDGEPTGFTERVAKVRNNSDLPIYHVALGYFDYATGEFLQISRQGMMGPVVTLTARLPELQSGRVTLSVEFRDRHQTYWTRDGVGNLVEGRLITDAFNRLPPRDVARGLHNEGARPSDGGQRGPQP